MQCGERPSHLPPQRATLGTPQGRGIGVVTAVRNAGQWFDEMLCSLRDQTHQDWQLVIVDDLSADNSREIAERHAREDARIRVVAGDGEGAPAARALGRRLLDGEPQYLYFPDADDLLAPTLLEQLAGHLDAWPDADAAYCKFQRIDEEGNFLDWRWPSRFVLTRFSARELPESVPATPFHSIYAWAAPVMEAIVMMRATAYDRSGGWDLFLGQGGEGVDLYSRIALHGEVHLVPETLYSYRLHDRQHTVDIGLYARRRLELRELWRERVKASPDLAAIVAEAEFFVKHRYAPLVGYWSARRLTRERQYLQGLRFLAGAVSRYRPFPPRRPR